MSEANKVQIGGTHYQGTDLQHWDIVKIFDLDYFQGNITKYVFRHKKKNGVQDLKKAQHYLTKYIELLESATQDKLDPHAVKAVATPNGFNLADIVLTEEQDESSLPAKGPKPNAVDPITGAPGPCLGCGAIYGHRHYCPAITG